MDFTVTVHSLLSGKVRKFRVEAEDPFEAIVTAIVRAKRCTSQVEREREEEVVYERVENEGCNPDEFKASWLDSSTHEEWVAEVS